MRRETAAIHAGYDPDPTTRAVAVPIYQTVAYAFDSADHAAALFNLKVEGHRYARISNPTTAVLEKRIAALEGGIEALAVSSGQAALHYALLNLSQPGRNIVSVPQLYGTTHTLFAHFLPGLGIQVRFAESDSRGDRPTYRRRHLCGVLRKRRQSCRKHVRHRRPGGGRTRNATPLVVDNTVATPILLRPFDHGADVVVHSLTKFLGGHGTTLGGDHRRLREVSVESHDDRFPMFSSARPILSRPGLRGALRRLRLHRQMPQLFLRTQVPHFLRLAHSFCCRASRAWL